MTWVSPNQYDPTDTCPICYEEYGLAQAVYKTSCGHLFHNDCLNAHFEAHNPYMNPTCPVCRSDVPNANMDVWAFKNKALGSRPGHELFNGDEHLIQIYNAQP